ETRRNTQIMYPKDIGFILLNMDIGPGRCVVEAGTGSGSFTTALAFIVGPQGRVISYESRPEFQHLAHKNLDRLGLAEQVDFKLRDIMAGFDERNVDAVFLDLPNPQDYVVQARQALKPGGYLGSILPTTNQVSLFLAALRRENFAFIEVCEILLRYYKAVADRLRPTDRMVAHTGYLIFSRSVVADVTNLDTPDPGQDNLPETEELDR
ncbi:MAG: tRNA (adenine-N1)-methyltransferase, partial [Acidobacteriaceae bacterium]